MLLLQSIQPAGEQRPIQRGHRLLRQQQKVAGMRLPCLGSFVATTRQQLLPVLADGSQYQKSRLSSLVPSWIFDGSHQAFVDERGDTVHHIFAAATYDFSGLHAAATYEN